MILVNGNKIFAVDVTETDEAWESPTVIVPKSVLPDAELIEAELPEGFTITDYEWNGTEIVRKPVVVTDAQRKALAMQIDSDVDAIYLAVQGQRGTEYLRTEQEAQAYKDADYQGTAPATVTAWADAMSKTAQWATDDILATAALWRTAQSQLRAQRLMSKQEARSSDDLALVKAEWDAFLGQAKAALGL